MTIAEYQTLTGRTVSSGDVARITAHIRRAEAKLETLLGYSLSRQKKWTELGKAQYDGLEPSPSLPLPDAVLAHLAPASEQIGDIQLFNFDPLDTHFRITPAKEVYRATIVLPVNQDEFVSIYELYNATPYLNPAGFVTAVTRYNTWFTWTWWTSLLWSDRKNLMIAVDGDYANLRDVNKYPDLAYLLVDMVDYYSDPGFSLLGNIHSESIDSHSYMRKPPLLSNPEESAPESQPSAELIIAKYAGPAAFRKLVR